MIDDTGNDSRRDLRAETRELDKCRELLSLHYKLNSLYKTEVEKLSGLLQRVETFDEKHQRRPKDATSDREVSPPDVHEEFSVGAAGSYPIPMTKGRGLVEIHIRCLRLTAPAKEVLLEGDDNVFLFVSWDIRGQETAFTPLLKYPKLNFDSSSVYRVPDLFDFFEKILDETVAFRVHAVDRSANTRIVARAKLCIKDVLDYPLNELQYVVPVYDACGMSLGQLSLWIRLSCDVDAIEAFKRKRNSATRREVPRTSDDNAAAISFENPNHLRSSLKMVPESKAGSSRTQKNYETDHVHRREVVDDPEQLTREIVGCIPDHQLAEKYRARRSNETLEKITEVDDVKTTSKPESSHDVSPEMSKEEPSGDSIIGTMETADDTDESKSDKTEEDREEDEIFSTMIPLRSEARKDVGAQKRTPSIIESNPPLENIPLEEDTIVIEIESVFLYRRTSLIDDPDVNLLYVEYTFLGHRGADMETVSVPKPKTHSEPMTFNFRKKFKIDEKTHSSQRNVLRGMLSGTISPLVEFVLVSEPDPSENDMKECVEVGRASFDIKEYATGQALREVPLIMVDPERTGQIGVLKILVEGVEAIRRCMPVLGRFSVISDRVRTSSSLF